VDEYEAQLIAEHWSGGSGLVPRGPRQLLACQPATAADVERHTGRRPASRERLWRLEVGGRFLRSGGLVYPGGVPFPEELHSQTAVIANEVWLYVDEETHHVLGAYWWPDAVRRPIASRPHDEYPPDEIVSPADADAFLDFELRVPTREPWQKSIVFCPNPREAVVFCMTETTPDPLHEMLLFEQGGLSMRAHVAERAEDLGGFLRANSPPYRRLSVGRCAAAGRDPGRALGPQTWPWPAELRWWDAGVAYELKGLVPLQTLVDVANSLAVVTDA
jgi:hypothetical protein